MKHKSKIAIAILTVLLAATLVAGGTFALFTDTVSLGGNIATAGKVAVDADITLTSIYEGVPSNATTVPSGAAAADFANGGKVIVGESRIAAENITPGDGAFFDIKVTNASDIKIQYKIIISLTEAALFDEIDLTFDGGSLTFTDNKVETAWTEGGAAGTSTTFPMSVGLNIDAGNGSRAQSFGFDITVFAIQSNATNNVVFATTAAAINNAPDAARVVLYSDITGDINISKSLSLDLNGFTVTGAVNVATELAVDVTIGNVAAYEKLVGTPEYAAFTDAEKYAAVADTVGQIIGTVTVTAPNASVRLHYAQTEGGIYSIVDA